MVKILLYAESEFIGKLILENKYSKKAIVQFLTQNVPVPDYPTLCILLHSKTS